MFCTKCGATIEAPAKFCSKCGAPVDAASAPNPAPAPNPVYAAPNPAPASNPVYTAPNQTPAHNPVYAAPNQAPAPNPVYTAPNPAYAAPAQNPIPGAYPAPAKKGKVVYGVNTLIGIIGAFAVFISLFLDLVTASAGILGSESVTFVALMKEGEAEFVTIIVIASIALTVLFQLVKCPKVSLIGILGMIFGLGITMWAVEEVKPSFGGLVKFSYGIGFWLYIAGMLVCIIGAFLKKKRI